MVIFICYQLIIVSISELEKLKHPVQPLEATFSIVDTLVLARRLHPGQKNNLDALCKRYHVDNEHRQYHGALLDADILAKVYLSMTAGQSSLAFGSDTEIEAVNTSKQNTYASVKRTGVLPVTRATVEEQQLHEKILSEIQ